MAGPCCSTELCNMANGSGSLLLYYKQITCKGWIICSGQPGASYLYSLALSVQSFFSPLQVSSCCFCWCSSVSDSKRKHASAWHLMMVPARCLPKRFRKCLVCQIPAFRRHRSRQAASFACWFRCIWMEQCIQGKRREERRHYLFQVLQALKSFTEKNPPGNKKKAIKMQHGS